MSEHDVRLLGNGSDTCITIKRLHYTSNNRIRINEKQYFEGVPREVFEFHIGGYQVCRKWLKDRKEKILSRKDVNYFGKIVKAIQETIRLMEKIDQTIDKSHGWPEAFFSSSSYDV